MKQSDCYLLGKVIKTHGLSGETNISLEVDFPDDYQNLESVFLAMQGKLVPFFIESIQVQQRKALVKFEDIGTLDQARELIGAELYLPLSLLPKLDPGQYYYHDLVGCDVLQEKQHIGTITEVIDLAANPLLTINSDGKEILVPLRDEILISVDVDKKIAQVRLPEGLLDLYEE